MVLFDPGLSVTADMPIVDLTTLTGHAVHTRSLESEVIFYRPKEFGDLVWGKVHRLDVPRQQPADVIESRAHVGQVCDQAGHSRGGATLSGGLSACLICQLL
jgi:hypothetical protein